MRDTDWQILYELKETENITKAAEHLYISQPAFTKRLKVIEDEFGITIVRRSTKGVAFTREGELLAEKAAEYLAFLERTRKEIEHIRSSEKEVITIGMPYTFTRYFMPDMLSSYLADNQDIQFDIQNDTSTILFRKACEGEVDAAFVRGDYSGDVERGRVDDYYAYILTKEPVQLSDLPGMTRIKYRTNEKSRQLIEEWWKEQYGTESPDGFSSGNYVDAAWELVGKGLGYCICFLPESYQNPLGLVLTPMQHKDGTPVIRSTWFVYKDRKDMSKPLRKFIRYVEDNIVIEM